MMYPPNKPKPSLAYVAEQRKACKAPQQDQAPFWMLQSVLASSVPDENKILTDENEKYTMDFAKWSKGNKGKYQYNNVNFIDVLSEVNKANGSGPELGKPCEYIAMGSVFDTKSNEATRLPIFLDNRFFLVKVGDDRDYMFGNETFAPAGSYILSFSATDPVQGLIGEVIKQDGICGAPGACPCIGLCGWTVNDLPVMDPPLKIYKNEFETSEKMFRGIPAEYDGGTLPDDSKVKNPMMGLTKVLDNEPGFRGGGKEITIVGWSLGGAQAQIAAVKIAVEYNAKVRLITFDSIMAFTPVSAAHIAYTLIDDKLLGRNDFPEAGKINAQRWVEDDSPASIAPFIWPMAGCCPFSLNKTKYAGCYPYMSTIGDGHISKALILSGYHAGLCMCLPACGGGTPTWTNLGCIPKNLCFLCDSNPTYSFQTVEPSQERAYVTKAANLYRCVFCGYILCVPGGATNHLGPFLLWMLYKGAYQNVDSATADPETKTPNAVSIYQPTVYNPAVYPEIPEMDCT